MFPDLNFVDYVMIIFGGLLCFKRVAEMERYHNLRIIVLSSILATILFLFFVSVASALDDHFQYDYYEGPDHFTVSEMCR
jgi:hypothetical protein